MVQLLHLDPQQRLAELSVGAACPTCGGELTVKTSAHSGWSHCRNCRRLSPAKVVLGPGGVALLHPAAVA